MEETLGVIIWGEFAYDSWSPLVFVRDKRTALHRWNSRTSSHILFSDASKFNFQLQETDFITIFSIVSKSATVLFESSFSDCLSEWKIY